MDSSNISIFTGMTVGDFDEIIFDYCTLEEETGSEEVEIILEQLSLLGRRESIEYVPYGIIFKAINYFPPDLNFQDIVQSYNSWIAEEYEEYFNEGDLEEDANFKSVKHKEDFINHIRKNCGNIYDGLIINYTPRYFI